MSRDLLHEVRDVLRRTNAIRSEREFCEHWLGKSECYMRTLRFNQIDPSADALATLSDKLSYYAEHMRISDKTNLMSASNEFQRLSNACMNSIQQTARRKWMSAA